MPKHAAIRAAKPLHTPHDRHKVINRAPSPRWVENYREQITTRKLITRLQNFALDDPDNPTATRMTRTQAMVALALLRKILPDMQSVELSGNTDRPITIQVLRFSDPDETATTNGKDGSSARAVSGSEPLVIEHQPIETDANPLISLGGIDMTPRLIEDEPPAARRKPRSKRAT